jgi:hypothetical protein
LKRHHTIVNGSAKLTTTSVAKNVRDKQHSQLNQLQGGKMYFYYQNRPRKILWALFWIALGALLLLANYGLYSFHFSFSRDWPILIIAWGVMKVIDSFAWRKPKTDVSVLESEGDKQSREQILKAVESGQMSAEEAAQRLKNL